MATATNDKATATNDNTFPYALSVLGAGSYGTALALAVASKGVPVLLYARSAAKAQQMATQRENAQYLPQIKFPATLEVTADLERACRASRDLLVVVPSGSFVSTLQALKGYIHAGQRLAWATKGLDSSGAF